MKERKYGWKPDLPDHRDYCYKVAVETPLPSRVDLRSGCSPIRNQGQLGSCTGHAIVGCLEFLEIKDKLPLTDLSELFLYYQERVIERTTRQDAGAQIRDGIKAAASVGVSTEKLCPYNIDRFAYKPTLAAYADAFTRRISQYHRLTSIVDMKQCLASGFPFVFGFSVYESFESAAVARTGVVLMPGKTERILGGHAVMSVGYDDIKGIFIVRNSWGSSWGDKGYFYMPQGYLVDRNLSEDFWMVQKGNNI